MNDPMIRPQSQCPRRTFRLIQPGQQLRLAGAIFALTVCFAALAVGNSYAAYGSLVDAALTVGPEPLREDLHLQTPHFLRVNSALFLGYAVAVLALSVVYVRRLAGPVVALERHARALQTGDYRSRVGLRSGQAVYGSLASTLNDLAQRLEQQESRATTPSLP